MENTKLIEMVTKTAEFAEECRKQYAGLFNPYHILEGYTETKNEGLLYASLDYLTELERITEEYRKKRDNIALKAFNTSGIY